MRPSGRHPDAMRPISIEVGVTKHAEGSCMIKCGDTHVLCTASLETRVPSFLKNTGLGWVTAEYGMLPRSTGSRMRREASVGLRDTVGAVVKRKPAKKNTCMLTLSIGEPLSALVTVPPTGWLVR